MTIERLEELKTEAKHYGKMSESFRLDVVDLIDEEIERIKRCQDIGFLRGDE